MLAWAGASPETGAVYTDEVPRTHPHQVPELGVWGQGLELASLTFECMSSSLHPPPACPGLLCGLGQVTFPLGFAPSAGMS